MGNPESPCGKDPVRRGGRTRLKVPLCRTFSGHPSWNRASCMRLLKPSRATLTQSHRFPTARPATPPRDPCWSLQPPRPGLGLLCGESEERGAGHTGTGDTGTKSIQRDVMAGPGGDAATVQLSRTSAIKLWHKRNNMQSFC